MTTINKDKALEIQHKLIALGYELPKYGADGSVSEHGETWKALERFCAEHVPIDLGDDGLSPGDELEGVIQALLVTEPPVTSVDGVTVVDVTAKHPRVNVHGSRKWTDIDAIVLHQTAFQFTSEKEWYGLHAHIGIPPSGNEIFVVNPLGGLVWHGNGFNGRSVGLEVSGSFPGLSGKLGTHWKPPKGYSQLRHGPHEFLESQARATRAAIKFVCAEVERHQGKIKYIFAHRQASKDRIGDPGQDIWRQCGVWAKQELGLSDGGTGYRIGGGYPLPDEWTGEPRDVKYFA